MWMGTDTFKNVDTFEYGCGRTRACVPACVRVRVCVPVGKTFLDNQKD